jgi:outer membrane receptor protein involved in Fe transport
MGMKKKLFLLISIIIFWLLCAREVMSQSVIHGVIKDQGGRSVQYANVLLLKSVDSSLVKGTISDLSGKYSFENIKKGTYCIAASFTGMEQVFTKIFEINSDKDQIDQGVLRLRNTDAQLKEITVAAKRPMFEQKIDRMVINVKNSITNAGGTALDVLGKSPGVTVNRQNSSIAINGKSGVTIMINAKITYMPMDALVELLAGMPAGNIEKIELITTPPAKYDAAGNGGFINIVLINNPYAGFSGSYFLTGGYGIRETGAAGLNFNYRSAKINLYGNYVFNHDHNIQPTAAFTKFARAGNIITNTSFSNRDAFVEFQNARIGIDYQVDTATIIGALVSGYDRRWTMIAHNGVTTSKNDVPDTIITSVDNPELNHWQNIMANLNFQHTFKPGRVLFFDANYIYYKDNNPNTYSTNYYNGAKEFLYHEDSRGGKITPINFRVFSSDYTTPLGKKITMEAGAKISLSKFTNDVSVENLKGDIWIADSGLSANYLLKENIDAAYTSFHVNLNSKISMTAGLRYEYTTSNLGTNEAANIVNRKYGELFPTFSISQKLDDNNRINFSYSRRITRPTFNDLAPFTVFFDPKTFYSGNPTLQPAIANTIQASYIFKNYNVTITYTDEINTIDNFYFQVQRVDTISNIVYLSSRNFKSEQYLTASFSIPFIVTKWWTMQNSINLDWRQINTAYDKTPVLLRNYDYNINSTQRFTLPGNFSVELSGLYYSAYYVGTAKRKPLYQVDAGLQKKSGNKKDILRLTANDIFNSGSKYRFGEKLSTGAIVNRTFDFQMVSYKLTYTHNFGNRALKDKRERLTGAEDELKRVNN